MKKSTKQAFTLLEVLIVVGVLAVLGTVVVFVLKPTEHLAQARDANRLTDFKNLGLVLNMAEVWGLNLGDLNRVYVSLPSNNSNCSGLSLPSLSSPWEYRCKPEADYRKINGNGWIPVNFTLLSSGAPFAVLPIDPVNDANSGLYYTYVTGGSWELNAQMESRAYSNGGDKDVENKDGGDAPFLYEVSSNLFLVPDEINDRSGGGAAGAPTVTTLAASNITTSSATLNGSANPNSTSTIGWFRYDTTNPGSCNDTFGTRAPSAGGSSLGSGNIVVNYSQDIAGLVAGNTYYFCAIAENSYGKAFGGILFFTTTTAPGLPGRYWVGGTGNWSDTAHWSDSSNGAAGASVPTSADDVYFDANSFTAAGQTVTVDVAASTKNINWTGVTNNPTLAGASTLNIAGSLTLVSGMTRTYTGVITFSSTSAGNTITLAGKTLGGSVTFNGSGGGWTFQDAFNVGSQTITLTLGSLNTNSQTITCGTFSSSNSNTRSLTLGSSSITCSTSGTAWDFTTATNLTFNAGTSQITLTGSNSYFYGGGKTYNNVTFNNAGTAIISGINTFNNLTRTGTAVKTSGLYFSANQTITGTLTLSGNSVTNRLLVYSSTTGTPRTLTAATISVTNADFQDITGAGTGNWNLSTIIGGSGNAGGNSGITFTTAATQTWSGTAGGNWSTNAWTTRVPLPQDNVVMGVAFGTSQTVTADMPRLGASIDWTGATWTTGLTFTLSTTASIYGSLTLINGLTLGTGTTLLTFAGRGSYIFTSNGLTFEKGITLAAYGGTLTLQDALTLGVTRTLTITIGTFNANNKNVTAGLVSMGSGGTNIMGSGTWTLTGTGIVWTGAGTVTANASTIKLTNNSTLDKTFAGGGKIYNNFWNATAGTGKGIITGSNTFTDFKIDAGRTQQFTAGTATTVTTFTAIGSVGNLITIGSVTAASHTLTKVGGGTITCDYLSISYSTATPATTWYATNSTNGGNNTGWTFQ